MKQILSFRRVFLAMALAIGSTALFAQEGTDTKSLIESKRFMFKVNTAMPSSGATRQLYGNDYDITLKGDTVISFLPYFGRAFSAPYSPTDGGIKFTSTNFIYTNKAGKKGGWRISIKPKDVSSTTSDVREMNLSVSENGYGTLQVLSNNRQPISFSGQIAPVPTRK